MIRANNWINLDGTIVAAIISWDSGEQCLYKRAWFESVAAGQVRGIMFRKDFGKDEGTEEDAKNVIAGLQTDWGLEPYADAAKFKQMLESMTPRPDLSGSDPTSQPQ